jgi:2-oxoglutarate dehydrogenase E1 component
VVEDTKLTGFQDRVGQLIRNYRVRGHVIARFDPLCDERKDQDRTKTPEELTLPYFNFSEAELDRKVSCKTFQNGREMPLRELHARLKDTYCGSVGVEYMHIDDIDVRRWLQRRLEPIETRMQLGRDEQVRTLTRLTDAVMFEEFIRKKFVGAKSFSLEGCETLIPLLDLAIEKAAGQGVAEIVVGMAHRGRLNVLANILGKSPKQIFREFADKDPDLYIGRGDVKYHLGHSGDWITATGRRVHLSMCFNPSHLEFVNPVVLGRVRAKQDRVGDVGRRGCMALIIHGDAAFAGEGVVQETLNLSQLDGYRVGGAVHIIVNNQIGFTTGPREARSFAYATDVAKMLQSPILHVNGEDPDAVALCVRVAMDFRAEFKRDVFIDMYGYRRLGHNETDEPVFTQPLLYKTISKRKTVREGYLEHLLKLGGVTREEADQIAEQCRRRLEDELGEATSDRYQHPSDRLPGVWARSAYVGGADQNVPDAETAVSLERASMLLAKQAELPADFKPHAKIAKVLEARREMAAGRQSLDWASAEAVAFGSLVTEGVPIRLSGQDAERGTFSHRHAVIHDVQTGRRLTALTQLDPAQAPFRVHNSPLSEVGVLGFDYGYSLDTPDGSGDVGGAIRRLRERRPSDHRPVHRECGRQVASTFRTHHAVAARVRRAGAGTFECALGAIPGLDGRGQHPGLLPEHACPVLSSAAAPGAADVAEAAGGDDPEEPAAPSRLCIAAGGPDPGHVFQGLARHLSRTGSGQAHSPVHREGLLRSGRETGEAEAHRRRHRPVGANLPALPAGADGLIEGLCRRHTGVLGAGRARQHGGVAVPEGAILRSAAGSVPARLREPARIGKSGDRFRQRTQEGTGPPAG